MIRGTSVDPFGNLSMSREVIFGEILSIAQAVHNSGGIVIAQVREILDKLTPPQQVRVPGVLIDYVVPVGIEEHPQTFGEEFNPAYCEAAGTEESDADRLEPLPCSERRMIASRACDELSPGAIANLGIGMPECVARIAAERGLLDKITLSVESGTVGGMPAGGLSFGAARHPKAIIDQPAMFDFYDGGGLDFSALGAAQIDAKGNVNVSKFGTRFPGVGGFINISQTARKLVFCGTFRTDGLEVAVEAGVLRIVSEGRMPKFLRQVEQVSFNGAEARARGQEVLYVTERAVFRLADEGLELIEIAPGIDLRRDVLEQMEFEPIVRSPRTMEARHFAPPA